MSRGKLLINELIFYLFAQLFGLVSAWKILQTPLIKEQIEGQKISWLNLVISVIVGTILILLALRFLKHRAPYKIFFGFLFFLGSFYTLNLWLPSIPSLILTVILFWSHQRWPRIITHNLIIISTIIWTAVLLGLIISPWQMMIILLILSVYDMIAVWKTKHMITMFKGLAERGVIFALIIPTRIKNLFKPIPVISEFHSDARIDANNISVNLRNNQRESAHEDIGVNQRTNLRKSAMCGSEASAHGRDFLFLGTGDLALPMIFAISAFHSCYSWPNSCKFAILPPILIIAGALLGIAFINFVMMGKERKPLPALPPLAVGAILGWVISKIII